LAPDPALLKSLRERYDDAVSFGVIHKRLRDWDSDGNRLGYTLGCWLREHPDQVWLFTTAFEVEWTNNSSEIRASRGGCRSVEGVPFDGDRVRKHLQVQQFRWVGSLATAVSSANFIISGMANARVTGVLT
jgi:hypothetical protein